MGHSYGLKRKTRHKFRKGFRQHGAIHISKTLTRYKVGDIVDVAVDGATHKGMPYQYYHGRTGTVFNVNPRAIGVIVNKQVRNRIIPKRLHIRVEHLRLSTSRLDFLKRIRENDKVDFILFRKKKRATRKESEFQPKELLPNQLEPLKLRSPIFNSSIPSCSLKSYDSII
jgi:large subunit ribosomal protein L21e